MTNEREAWTREIYANDQGPRHALLDTEYAQDTRNALKSTTSTTTGHLAVQSFLDSQSLHTAAAILNPPGTFSKAYIHAERKEANDKESNTHITWNLSIGLSNYVADALATKILIENIRSIRVGSMSWPEPKPVDPATAPRLTTMLIEQFQTMSFQDTRNALATFLGMLAHGSWFSFRGLTQWAEPFATNIQERNMYLDRRGYSGSFDCPEQLERLEKITVSLANELGPIVQRQMLAPVLATTIGAGGRSVTIETTSNYEPLSDRQIVFIRGFTTTDPVADADLLSVINRAEGWNGVNDAFGVIELRDFYTSMNMQPAARIALNSFVFQGTPVLTNATVVMNAFNLTFDLELTMQKETQWFSF